jgi:hypothetical protein
MPVEGQWDRVNVPLRSHDRRVLAVMAALTAIAVIGGIVFALMKPAKSNAGCVSFTVPASVGGATIRYCGGKAKTFCATKGVPAAAAAECRRLGYLPG